MKYNEYSFKDLLSVIVDNRGKTCPAVESGIPLIATNCIKNDHLYPIYVNIRYVSQETYDTWFRGHPEPGDMIFVCKGSPGRVSWVPDPIEFCIAQDMVAIRADETKVYPEYLFALLRSEGTQKQIVNMHVGTLIPHFKKSDFGKLFLQIPGDYEYQKMVGNNYFKVCEKIELNHQINQTLESMAQAIFKSWFVDFDPVKAKIAAIEAGEDTEGVTRAAMRAISGKTDDELNQMQAEQPENYAQLKNTAELFPSAMQDSELGEVPEGWGLKPLYETAEYVNGAAFKAKYFSDNRSGLPIIKIAELKQGISSGTKYTNENVKKKYFIDNDDVLYSWSGSPETSLEVFKWFGGKGYLNQHIFKFSTSLKKLTDLFILYTPLKT
jgi:type I restriction enzyme, S subunit